MPAGYLQVGLSINIKRTDGKLQPTILFYERLKKINAANSSKFFC